MPQIIKARYTTWAYTLIHSFINSIYCSVRFVVKKDGTIGNVKLLRDIGGGCGQAVVEMVKSMPRWKPAPQSGKPVNCEFILPVKFQLADDEPDGTREEKCLFQYRK